MTLLGLVSLLALAVSVPIASASPLKTSTNILVNDLGPGKLGAVASESSICSRHGTSMLEIGGNAADAVSGITD